MPHSERLHKYLAFEALIKLRSAGQENVIQAPQIQNTMSVSKRHKPSKKWILNAFLMNTPGHQNPGLWSHPTDKGAEYKMLNFWVDLAVKLEEAKFNACFIADVLGAYDIYKGPGNLEPALIGGAQLPTNDPQLIVPAMAAVTNSIGFGITVSTTYEHPYDLARRFSTLDHLTEGRVGWNIVTSYLESAAKAHGLPAQIKKEVRYERADEYMDIVYKLWQGSWKDEAVILDKANNIYTDPSKVRAIHHHGKYFQVDGAHLCEPSKQRTPFLFQAGLSTKGKEFAGKHAEAVFVEGPTPEHVRKSVDDIRNIAEQNGRDRNSIKVVVGLCVIVDKTDMLAHAKYESYKKYANLEGALALFAGWSGIDLSFYPEDLDLKTIEGPIGLYFKENISKEGPITKNEFALELSLGDQAEKIIGSPQTVSRKLEEWINIGDLDGINLKYVHLTDTFDDFIELVIPELRERGHLDDDYFAPNGTLRENLNREFGKSRLDKTHYGHRFNWD